MATKTTGAEFKRYYNDKTAWKEDWWHENEEITIDGRPGEDIEIEAVADGAKIVIYGGIIYEGDYQNEGASMESHFKKWRKAQSVEFLTIEVPKDKSESLIAAVVAAGGKVVR